MDFPSSLSLLEGSMNGCISEKSKEERVVDPSWALTNSRSPQEFAGTLLGFDDYVSMCGRLDIYGWILAHHDRYGA